MTKANTSRSRAVNELEAFLQFGLRRFLLAPGTIALDPELNGIEQFLFT